VQVAGSADGSSADRLATSTAGTATAGTATLAASVTRSVSASVASQTRAAMSSVGASLDGSSAPEWIKSEIRDEIDTSPLLVAAALGLGLLGCCCCVCWLVCRYRGRVRQAAHEAARRRRALAEQRRDASIGLVRHNRYDDRHQRPARAMLSASRQKRMTALRRASQLDELEVYL